MLLLTTIHVIRLLILNVLRVMKLIAVMKDKKI